MCFFASALMCSALLLGGAGRMGQHEWQFKTDSTTQSQGNLLIAGQSHNTVPVNEGWEVEHPAAVGAGGGGVMCVRVCVYACVWTEVVCCMHMEALCVHACICLVILRCRLVGGYTSATAEPPTGRPSASRQAGRLHAYLGYHEMTCVHKVKRRTSADGNVMHRQAGMRHAVHHTL